jgi:hypothetical protein
MEIRLIFGDLDKSKIIKYSGTRKKCKALWSFLILTYFWPVYKTNRNGKGMTRRIATHRKTPKFFSQLLIFSNFRLGRFRRNTLKNIFR